MHFSSLLPKGIALPALLLISAATLTSAQQPISNRQYYQLVNRKDIGGSAKPCTDLFSSTKALEAIAPSFWPIDWKACDKASEIQSSTLQCYRSALNNNFNAAKIEIMKSCELRQIDESIAGDVMLSSTYNYDEWKPQSNNNDQDPLYVEIICESPGKSSPEVFDMTEYLRPIATKHSASQDAEKCPDFDIEGCKQSDMNARKARISICSPDASYRATRGLADPSPNRLYFNKHEGCWYRNLVFLDLIQTACSSHARPGTLWDRGALHRGAKAEGTVRVGTWTKSKAGKREIVWAYDVKLH
ncbi:hypothetical protein BJ508DRAFT_412417, partial [Ascobolus immersus RN42]